MRCKVMIKTKIQFGEIIFNVSRQFFFRDHKNCINRIHKIHFKISSCYFGIFVFFSCVFIPYVFLQNIPSVGFFCANAIYATKVRNGCLDGHFSAKQRVNVIGLSSSSFRRQTSAKSNQLTVS